MIKFRPHLRQVAQRSVMAVVVCLLGTFCHAVLCSVVVRPPCALYAAPELAQGAIVRCWSWWGACGRRAAVHAAHHAMGVAVAAPFAATGKFKAPGCRCRRSSGNNQQL